MGVGCGTGAYLCQAGAVSGRQPGFWPRGGSVSWVILSCAAHVCLRAVFLKLSMREHTLLSLGARCGVGALWLFLLTFGQALVSCLIPALHCKSIGFLSQALRLRILCRIGVSPDKMLRFQ